MEEENTQFPFYGSYIQLNLPSLYKAKRQIYQQTDGKHTLPLDLYSKIQSAHKKINHGTIIPAALRAEQVLQEQASKQKQ